MKNLLIATAICFSFTAMAEIIELKGRAQTIESTYNTVTTCHYSSAYFTVNESDLPRVRLFQKQITTGWWREVEMTYTQAGAGRVTVAVQPQSINQGRTRVCPNLQIRLLK